MKSKPYARGACPVCRTRLLCRGDDECFECAAPRPITDAEMERIRGWLHERKPMKYAATVLHQPTDHLQREFTRWLDVNRASAKLVERKLPAMAQINF